ncbi:MAG: hypothetical protein IPO55_02760 [Alphaproteobacteria bacterium]|nr:hypothetical protein [Alphaproteobacteria bacterium]
MLHLRASPWFVSGGPEHRGFRLVEKAPDREAHDVLERQRRTLRFGEFAQGFIVPGIEGDREALGRFRTGHRQRGVRGKWVRRKCAAKRTNLHQGWKDFIPPRLRSDSEGWVGGPGLHKAAEPLCPSPGAAPSVVIQRRTRWRHPNGGRLVEVSKGRERSLVDGFHRERGQLPWSPGTGLGVGAGTP